MAELATETQRDWDWTTGADVAEGPALADAGSMLLLSPDALAQEAGRPRLEPVARPLADAAYLDVGNHVDVDAPALSGL